MKYIRTKDGIYEAVTQNLYKNDDLLYIDGYGLERVIAQADTIEELCDYCLYYNCYDDFVIRKMPLSTSLESLYRDMQYKMVKDIKLAILTEKGLIYVAKMNESGCLELL